ncbi:flagellar biosynthetic protein FliO [Paracidovorax cattleyae]|uniref:Flagellar biosynthesis protein, FliO n=1 Tax=Paracidovorax cattleyae TaxID=80868 RepID=A0A1H0U927_9BURK|nr:flagellar biosynthetic protein FliO [Paracidovorax cattleyae]MBF9266909.1 flagellar biosynthetic protein FliO [Paracidovorax cattleyae]SDP62693.1 Flagellar biosynthesis protein, FliO [Paracidovorax cattleyae]
MALPESIPLRREPEGAGAPVPAAELAWMGVFVLLIALSVVAWRKHRARSGTPPAPAARGSLGRWMARVQQRSGRAVELVSSTRLTPQHSLHEVQWQGRRLLVGCAPQSISVLSESPAPGAAEPGHPDPLAAEVRS